MTAVIALIIGFLLGVAVFYRRPVGNLRIDQSDPADPPYLFLELSSDVGASFTKNMWCFGFGRKTFSRMNDSPYYGANPIF